ncbi:hypothetical protein ACIGW0_23605 [Streptomyces bikiniensis]|uniref:Uncharacterized protein n=1 Tax=Streptomyces bikiniensis TaxID=1896 RepID=A0ABW8CXN1_STRBI
MHGQDVAVEEEIYELGEILNLAGSACQVSEGAGGLEERVAPAVRDAAHRSITNAAAHSAAGSAADHLASHPWRAAYRRNSNPVRTYSESIKAVESATRSVIQPDHPKAALGTMLGKFKGTRHKFTFTIPTGAGDPIAPAEAVMRALWDGQTSRHGGQTPASTETLESARAGVHLAATLVQWFVSGADMQVGTFIRRGAGATGIGSGSLHATGGVGSAGAPHVSARGANSWDIVSAMALLTGHISM